METEIKDDDLAKQILIKFYAEAWVNGRQDNNSKPDYSGVIAALIASRKGNKMTVEEIKNFLENMNEDDLEEIISFCESILDCREDESKGNELSR